MLHSQTKPVNRPHVSVAGVSSLTWNDSSTDSGYLVGGGMIGSCPKITRVTVSGKPGTTVRAMATREWIASFSSVGAGSTKARQIEH